ncbi:unnamed protein product [Pylaiella littoralis]
MVDTWGSFFEEGLFRERADASLFSPACVSLLWVSAATLKRYLNHSDGVNKRCEQVALTNNMSYETTNLISFLLLLLFGFLREG